MFWKAILLLYLGGAVHIVTSFVELSTLHLADFIEFHSSLFGCKNQNSVTEELKTQYANCLSKNLPRHPKGDENDYLDLPKRVCSNENAYRKCWEPVIRKSKECNSANGKGYPTSFSMVVKAVCKNDRGRSFMDASTKSLEKMIEMESANVDKDEICTATGEHWMKACKDLDIASRDICKKHSEINKCIEKIICKEIPMGQLLLDVYREAGQIEGCSSQNATAKSTTPRSSHHTKKPFYFINHS